MRTSIRLVLSAVIAALFAAPVFAQEGPKPSEPSKEHAWLKQFEGDWDTEMEAKDPSGKDMKCQGSMKSRMLGGLWAVNEMKGEMMGQSMQGIQTIGYDEKKKKYVGTWVDNHINYMWKYEGTVDSTGKIIHLDADGPDFANPEKTGKFRDSYEFKSKDEVVVTSSMMGPDGKWMTFMSGKMKRKK